MLSTGKYIFIVVFLTLLSCNDSKLSYEEIYNKHIENKDSLYRFVYSSALDSIQSWINSDLESFAQPKFCPWKLDSFLLFNYSRDKCFMFILIQNIQEGSTMDDIWYLYGEKINRKWYYYSGADLTISREAYTKDIRIPLAFTGLSQIAHNEELPSYIKKTLTGEYEINPIFFKSRFESNAWGAFSTKEEYDSLKLHWVKENWKKKIDKPAESLNP